MTQKPKSPWDYFVEVNKRLPTLVEFYNMDRSIIHDDCHHPENLQDDGYGLAGGGMGHYIYCEGCNRILAKDQDRRMWDE